MKKYLLIVASQDGDTFDFYEEISEILKNPEDYSIEKFLSVIPDEPVEEWELGTALILRVKPLKVEVKTTSYKICEC